MNMYIIIASLNASTNAPCTLRTEKHKALLKDEEWAKLPSKVQESPYFSDGKLLFDAERLGISWMFHYFHLIFIEFHGMFMGFPCNFPWGFSMWSFTDAAGSC